MRQAAGQRGFTLIELLVTLTVMSVLTLMSWRGLDGMLRTRELVIQRNDSVLTLQTALMQWAVDLDHLFETQVVSALDFDGSVLRLTRRDRTDPNQGLRVVAWARRGDGANSAWVRWQSAPLYQRSDLLAAWQKAYQWGREPRPEDTQGDIPLARLDAWQLYYFRNNAWSNPLSSASEGLPPGASNLLAVPDGVRLVLQLSNGQALSGELVRDWVDPAVGGGKS